MQIDKELADIAKEREVMLAAANDKSGPRLRQPAPPGERSPAPEGAAGVRPHGRGRGPRPQAGEAGGYPAAALRSHPGAQRAGAYQQRAGVSAPGHPEEPGAPAHQREGRPGRTAHPAPHCGASGPGHRAVDQDPRQPDPGAGVRAAGPPGGPAEGPHRGPGTRPSAPWPTPSAGAAWASPPSASPSPSSSWAPPRGQDRAGQAAGPGYVQLPRVPDPAGYVRIHGEVRSEPHHRLSPGLCGL